MNEALMGLSTVLTGLVITCILAVLVALDRMD